MKEHEQLKDLVDHLKVAALGVAPHEIPAALGNLEAVKAELWARLMTARDGRQQMHETADDDRLLTVTQVARILSLRPQYLYELLRQGRFPAVRVGKYVRIHAKDLQGWIDRHREKGLDETPCLPYGKTTSKRKGR